MLDRFGRILRQQYDQPGPPPPTTTPETLAPGNVILLQDRRDFLVKSTMDCTEEVDGRVSNWRWLLLDDRSLLEVRSHTMNLFGPPEILRQGTPSYALLIGEGAQDGLLRLFEARVRDGTSSAMPVTYEHDGATYRICSTGSFSAHVVGGTDSEVWAGVSAKAADNVYFKLEGPAGEPALGIWTTHMAFSVGTPLTHADIKGMYSH